MLEPEALSAMLRLRDRDEVGGFESRDAAPEGPLLTASPDREQTSTDPRLASLPGPATAPPVLNRLT